MPPKLEELSDHEGALLALIDRQQPVTAYQIAKLYEHSPVSNFSGSPGKVYPLIKRLRARGLVEAELVEGDARGTERWTCTPAGRDAIRIWLKQVRPSHLMLDDPLRTKLMSFYLLDKDERVEWLMQVKAELMQKLVEVEKYDKGVSIPFQEEVRDNAISSLRARMDWLDRTLIRAFNSPD